jgi:uncharacterized spore protein YtfJ
MAGGREMVVEDPVVMEEARGAAERETMADRLLQRLVDRIGGRSGVTAVFGEPVQRGDVTVIPVARQRWFVGAGAGSSPVPGAEPGAEGSGSGGGGGAIGDPVGYIEMSPSGVTFRSVGWASPNPLAILALGIAAALVLRGIARLLGR